MPSVALTVLVVDDEKVVLALMERTLVAEGYGVLTASNGEEALALARTFAGSLSLVITDIRMPEMTGIELAAHLTRLTPAPRMLFITGYSIPPDELPGPFLLKPFTPDDLANYVRRMLDGPEAAL